MDEWDGIDRRKMNQLDHDLLIEIKNDTRHLVTSMEAHILEDRGMFKAINDKIGWLQKGAFMVLGALAILKLLFK